MVLLLNLTAIGKAAIFIPFPFAADNHQELNARALENRGAAEVILERDLDETILAERIESYAAHPETIKKMGTRAKTLGKPEAAYDIVAGCAQLVGHPL